MKTIKLYAAFMALFLLFALPACHKDKAEPEPTTAKLLIGKWMVTDIGRATEPSEAEPLTDCEKQSYFQFNKDGSFAYLNVWDENGGCESDITLTDYSLTAENKKLF